MSLLRKLVFIWGFFLSQEIYYWLVNCLRKWLGTTYTRKVGSRPYANYSTHKLEEALQAMKKGLSAREASKRFNISHATLSRKKKGNSNRAGRPNVFTEEEEDKLAKCILCCADWSMPMMMIDLQLIVQSYLNLDHFEEYSVWLKFWLSQVTMCVLSVSCDWLEGKNLLILTFQLYLIPMSLWNLI